MFIYLLNGDILQVMFSAINSERKRTFGNLNVCNRSQKNSKYVHNHSQKKTITNDCELKTFKRGFERSVFIVDNTTCYK